MLTYIRVRDFAIIEELALEFKSGMSVLTGETGAGKSIIIDAIGLVLGDRADSDTVRHGAKRAEISIVVDITRLPTVKSWLIAHELDSDGECMLRRVIHRDGRSRAYINGTPASLGLFRSLGELLVEIHGQHEHQSLMRRDMQRQLLDDHAGNKQRLQQLAKLYRHWLGLKRHLETLTSQQEQRQAQIDLLRYQIEELMEADLDARELNFLDEEHHRLANVEQLQRNCHEIYVDLYESDELSLYSHLGRRISQLDDIVEIDHSLKEFRDLLVEAQLQIGEAASGLQRYINQLEADPKRLAWLDNRLALIHDLARKHQIAPEHLPERLVSLKSELASLECPEHDPQYLRTNLDQIASQYRDLAQEIHNIRKRTATLLSKQTTVAMRQLGMRGGKFQIDVKQLGESHWSPTGLDKVDFLVSTSAGQPLKALNKVVSGGELSRISLAIQMVAARSMPIHTLIFDEIDTGIGGAIAETVGKQLHALGKKRQVLCVTHLPQVAAQAHHHFQVNKVSLGASTETRIIPLRPSQRIEEIARMLGGVEMTDQTRAHATEMISRAQGQ